LSRWRNARILFPIAAATTALLSSGETIASQKPRVKISLMMPNCFPEVRHACTARYREPEPVVS
jgi:hypothetical protein